ncbi:proline--tRNA ligase [Curtobacterium sp. VKM Ac-1393]|uniref:proline--tRNA ligase n=1 Tax=Curtobacterium sp. VKM Ac-1393 TaxID=2783814 RepID=UPI00188BEEC3|nr:proline--tRNA ligase [Curtobacterium sp. VKM Ac-1393]MBF4608383.1 proline--tRNA ligase [Curtobacterium sp. VKM Ac-1393]
MVTRLSHLFLRTLRDDPSDAEVTSHKLLVRAGYVRRQSPGIFAWLPLGLRVRAKIEGIIRDEMVAAGAQEVLLPALLPREPYEATNRWTEYGDGMFRLQDRKGSDYLLAPTHEEMFALLVKDLYSSYKDLPVTLFQIQDKYRDEARPRAGLLRGREFTMKDAYSFDLTDEGLERSYQVMRDAYEKIFARLGLEYVIVKADAGAMGGSKSEEFLHPIAVGEDTFVRSANGYAANVEAYVTPVPASLPIEGQPDAVLLPSSDTPTIDTLVAHANQVAPRDGAPWTAADTLKNVVLALTHLDGTREVVVVGLPGDRDVDLKRAEVAFAPAEVEAAGDDDFRKNKGLVKGYIGPQVLGADSATGIRYFVDPRVVDGTAWLTGANERGVHVSGLVAGRDFVADGVAEVSDVRAGDPSPDGSGPLETARGMEIGHVFQLGRKYAEALGLKVQDENGKLATVTMGSYGIGVTRILAILAEAHNDDKGLAWPKNVAPFDVHIVATGRDQVAYDLATSIVAELEGERFDVLYDDRPKVSPGVKLRDAELLGMPIVVVAGRGAADGVVELWNRASGERRDVPVAELLDAVRAI